MGDRAALGVGATLSSVGASAAQLSVAADARAAEAVGFDSVWVFDHVLMPEHLASSYPFTDSGEILWKLDDPWFDSLIWATAAALATQRVEVGTNILLASLRPPLQLSKQIATIDQLSGGRFTLGVGAGWLLEEFAALGCPPPVEDGFSMRPSTRCGLRGQVTSDPSTATSSTYRSLCTCSPPPLTRSPSSSAG